MGRGPCRQLPSQLCLLRWLEVDGSVRNVGFGQRVRRRDGPEHGGRYLVSTSNEPCVCGKRLCPITSVDPLEGCPIRSGFGRVPLRHLKGVVRALPSGARLGWPMTGLLGWRVSKGTSGTRCFYLNLFPLPCRDVRVTFDPHSVAEIAPHITLVYQERDHERRIPQGTPYRNQRRNQPLSTPTVRATNLGVGTGRGIYLSVEDVGRAVSALRGRLTASLTWSPPPTNRVSTARHPGSPWPDEPSPMSGGFEHSESWVPADRRFHYCSVSVIQKGGRRWRQLHSIEFGDTSA